MIGIFDSGLGGFTVVKEVMRQLPGLGIVYFGDTARTPYGTKSKKLVTAFAIQDAEFLISKGAKLLVVACNTASALAANELKRRFRVPIFEVVTPAVRKAVAITRGNVGVIGTRSTVSSGVYERKMKVFSPGAKTIGVACPLFVPLVEEDWFKNKETELIASRYLSPLRLHGADTLILGCTHYPFLRHIIKKAADIPGLKLVDPAVETVLELKRYLAIRPKLAAELTHRRPHRFYVSDKTENFSRIASSWLGRSIRLEQATVG